MLLKGFQFPDPGKPAPMVVQIGDPALKPLLDEVWLPMWAGDPEVLEDPMFEADTWPGLELARRKAGIHVGPPAPGAE